ncbi:MAG: DNA-binding protein HU [Candidatus Nealsonbacteria bacterium CG_4_8_14_3_um_filter_34_13]|uniref:DNA-binding protein HU n=1 Tax=Candidatus Nealsonbacteria bacterium CG11_big_fil_rev_8_21_14_0_20_35_11 TaxID=1974713 RepID=A0A2H0N0F8_9BACT|nr:MAG: DNA-binding protein HU [Candidatus Nealsonbacteria bacterium CG11_big_fil_rev_8_21_14_0_20_35_11]PIW92844.1 MAG: DNA-binding protein HU [Candidatus Nealsonbacteria bacterium CG_4_8_14_3_um_filter_34_13]
MTKENLIEAIVKKTAVSKKQAAETLSAVLEEITKSLSKGEQVVLTGFGTFKVSKRAARNGRNPKTGATIKIPAMKVARFKVGKSLKDAVR